MIKTKRADQLRPGDSVTYADRKSFVIQKAFVISTVTKTNNIRKEVEIMHVDGSQRTMIASATVKINERGPS